MAGVSYREHAPPPALAAWLECTWQREGLAGPPVRVVPDGCIDIVWTEGDGTYVVGANTTAFLVSIAPGTRVAGARMRPGAAAALLGLDAQEVRDGRVPLEEGLGDDGRRLGAALDEGDATPVRTLLGAVAAPPPPSTAPDPLVRAAVARLERPGALVASLAGELYVSERQLRRRMASAVGYGPKRLARVLRLRRALDAAARGVDLAWVAVDAGYSDQTHFTHDCTALAGVSPGRFLQDAAAR